MLVVKDMGGDTPDGVNDYLKIKYLTKDGCPTYLIEIKK